MATVKVLITIIVTCLSFGLARRSCVDLPVRINSSGAGKVGDGVCLSEARLNVTRAQIQQIIKDSIVDESCLLPGMCNGTGWTRVAFLNMSNPVEECPSNLSLHNFPVRGCGKRQTRPGCDSIFFTPSIDHYSRVCGRVFAYQRGSTDAFYNYISLGQTTIDSAYVDGVSITHGPASSRQHIWTFVTALYEQDPRYDTRYNCACTNIQYRWLHRVPTFIGNNYFCETGSSGPGWDETTYYPNDTLWDGKGCGPFSTCCQFNNPPWFQTTLPQTTSDDIELRLCHGNENGEDTIIYLIEIYVK